MKGKPTFYIEKGSKALIIDSVVLTFSFMMLPNLVKLKAPVNPLTAIDVAVTPVKVKEESNYI